MSCCEAPICTACHGCGLLVWHSGVTPCERCGGTGNEPPEIITTTTATGASAWPHIGAAICLLLSACSTPPPTGEVRAVSLAPIGASVTRADGKAVVILSRAERQRRLLEEARGLLGP